MSTEGKPNPEDVGSFRNVEISSAFTHLPKKDMAGESPLSSPTTARRLNNHQIDMIHSHVTNNGHDEVFRQQILELKHQQQLQQQYLLQEFQAQQQKLAEQHEQQMKQHLKEIWEKQQREREMEEQRREKERLETLKKKEKHHQSAIASSEVKQKLQGFLLNKKQQREAAAAANGSFTSWSSDPSTPPYRLSGVLGKYSEEEFPLRKTASEPNLLVQRLKHRVFENSRVSPLVSRRRDHRVLVKRKSQLTIDASGSTPESGPNSPTVILNPASSANTPIVEEGEPAYGKGSDQNGSMCDLTSLYTSPSLPNISLGRPPSASEGKKLASVSEAEVRAAFTSRLGLPLPYYPSLSMMEPSLSPAPAHLTSSYHPSPITDSQVAHARLNKAGKRPLGRTQSAPLPLGHPMLAGSTGAPLVIYEHETGTGSPSSSTSQHSLLKQHIRQTVLTRVGSRAASNSSVLSDTPENAVIDLTGGPRGGASRLGSVETSDEEESEMAKQMRERESFLQQQRDLMMRHGLQVDGSVFTPRLTPHSVRPLSRALSSPLVALSSESPSGGALLTPRLSGSPHLATTGLGFDSLMLKHGCVCGDNTPHPEHGGRLQSVWARLVETGLVQRCDRIRSRKAGLDELQTCHTESHCLLFGTNPLNRQKLDLAKLAELQMKTFVRLECGGIGVDSDTTWNELHTAPAARTAAGCVIDLSYKAFTGDIRNGLAIVRPPGHHAEESQAMGFCFFNSVAVAAKLLIQKLDLKRILILDWDVHHGNGTQQIFYSDKRVLYLSIHRHDDGNFFPGTGGPIECGSGAGLGFNINIAWSGALNPPMGDAEYLAAFRTIVMPVAKEFDPQIVLVSAGFDAAAGHPPPLGGYKLSPACFGYMTQQLMSLADGKVVLALEGGYDLPSMCDSAEACVRALLGDSPPPLSQEELIRSPCAKAVETLQKTIAIQISHWPVLKRSAHTITWSALSAAEDNETVSAMASLSMNKKHLQSPEQSIEIEDEPMEEDEIK
uniref:Histone deacetylase n=1 Tax=Cacopsylla melanoneura TaxID=428564 RepID=A0A8D8W924_9HEMI